MVATFKAQWAENGAWRRDFCFLLRLFSQWLKDNGLLDLCAQDRIKLLEQRVRSEKLMVAFVAEYSRGKSELINALFFAEFGRRIMPTSAGRTTMCPTEIGYDPDTAPSLRLLPIHTRLLARAMADWRKETEAWISVALDVKDADQIARSMERVTETTQVSPKEAQDLGLWHAQTPQGQWAVDAQGMVQIPKWRHALLNIEHPLLNQGLVILDTPGLNALGAEPELTIGLLDQAQAHIFILSADSGVSKSDLAMWHANLAPHMKQTTPTLVVLNKIDTLWDELSSADQVANQIDAQMNRAASALGLRKEHVIAVSAQKGLVAKISNQPALLERSRLLQLEAALALGMLGQRQRIVRAGLQQGIHDLTLHLNGALDARASDLKTQRIELESLRGKSQQVLLEMHARITWEQRRFEEAGTRMAAIKSVYRKLFHKALEKLGPQELQLEMQILADALSRPGLKWEVKKIYGETFDRLQTRAKSLQSTANDLEALQLSTFTQLNADYGFMLRPIAPPTFSAYQMDLELTKRSHLAYVGFGHALRLQRIDFVRQVVRTLSHRLESLQSTARSEAHQWRLSVVAQLESQIALRRAHFVSRLETVEKIQRAADGFNQRLHHIMECEQNVRNLREKLVAQTGHLRAANDETVLHAPTA